MNIAFFVDTYFPQLNGVTISVKNFTDQLRKDGHSVTIFAPKIPGAVDSEKYVFRLSAFKAISAEPDIWFPLPIPNKNFREMFRQPFDVIHAHGNGVVSLFGLGVAKARKIPFILTFHTIHTLYTHYVLGGKLITPRMASFALKTFGNQCDGVITPSEKMRQELIAYGLKKHVSVVPNFIDLSIYKKNIKIGYLHKLLNLSEELPIIFTAGRLGIEKNFSFLLKVMQRVIRVHKNVHFVIAGKGPEQKNLESIAKQLGIGEKVHFAGAIDALLMPSAYKDSVLFVFSSVTETQGICVLEAAAAGLPVVVVDDSAFLNIIIDGINGYSVKLDEEKFSEKVDALLSNKNLREAFGRESEKIARENFSPEKITNQLITFYNEIISSYKNGHRKS